MANPLQGGMINHSRTTEEPSPQGQGNAGTPVPLPKVKKPRLKAKEAQQAADENKKASRDRKGKGVERGLPATQGEPVPKDSITVAAENITAGGNEDLSGSGGVLQGIGLGINDPNDQVLGYPPLMTDEDFAAWLNQPMFGPDNTANGDQSHASGSGFPIAPSAAPEGGSSVQEPGNDNDIDFTQFLNLDSLPDFEHITGGTSH